MTKKSFQNFIITILRIWKTILRQSSTGLMNGAKLQEKKIKKFILSRNDGWNQINFTNLSFQSTFKFSKLAMIASESIKLHLTDKMFWFDKISWTLGSREPFEIIQPSLLWGPLVGIRMISGRYWKNFRFWYKIFLILKTF